MFILGLLIGFILGGGSVLWSAFDTIRTRYVKRDPNKIQKACNICGKIQDVPNQLSGWAFITCKECAKEQGK